MRASRAGGRTRKGEHDENAKGVCAKKDRREGMSGLRNVGVEWARGEKEKVGAGEPGKAGVRGREDQGDAREQGRRVRG